MAGKPEDGGAAFPVPPLTYTSGGVRTDPLQKSGMTLRDYMAGQALVGLVSNFGVEATKTQISLIAYEIADAMLQERGRK